MAKKMRTCNPTIYYSIEGRSEFFLLEHLNEIYKCDTILPDNPLKSGGGTSDSIVNSAMTTIDTLNPDKVFAWFDEDIDLSAETRKSLARHWGIKKKDVEKIILCPLLQLQKRFNRNKRNPILIVSHPVCVESLILKILGKKLPYDKYDPSNKKKQIHDLKSALNSFFDYTTKLTAQKYYRDNLNKDTLEKKRKTIPELNLLIEIISKKK